MDNGVGTFLGVGVQLGEDFRGFPQRNNYVRPELQLGKTREDADCFRGADLYGDDVVSDEAMPTRVHGRGDGGLSPAFFAHEGDGGAVHADSAGMQH